MANVYLVSCAKTKRDYPTRADRLYASPLFDKSRALAAARADKWFILSAKYGLLDPCQVVEPYDESLRQMTAPARRLWAERVMNALKPHLGPGDTVTVLAGSAYSTHIASCLSQFGVSVIQPLAGRSLGDRLRWLNLQLLDESASSDLNRLYNLLDRLAEGVGGPRSVAQARVGDKWPRRGLYLFFEPGEYRAHTDSQLRIVRVGTHAVSTGSVSTLWGRLRAHKGTGDGNGNHRGSIFRLHVGSALLARGDIAPSVPTWGAGHTAPRSVREAESHIERSVTEYIGAMSILWLNVDDVPGPASDRAYLERNIIALVSNRQQPADPPSGSWLGRWSPYHAIRESGLWNLRHTLDTYDPLFLGVLELYVQVTLGELPLPAGSMAPRQRSGRGSKPSDRTSEPSLFDKEIHPDVADNEGYGTQEVS